MDFLRQIVGGPKNRYRQFGYNLDLTYISDRVIAMAFPASGIQKLYRNSVDSIRSFLQTAHQNKYITVNISGRDIQQQKLQNVVSYSWEDHKAPPFDTLFVICEEVANFMAGDMDRIAVFHCNHGKGRTGTIICCFFLYLGIFKETSEVMKFYALRRFASEGYGVTQPCQIKYIQYFATLLANPELYPKVYTISEIKFTGEFTFGQPYVKIYRLSGTELVYNSKNCNEKFYQTTQNELHLNIKKKFALAGDIVIELKEHRSLGKNLLISYVFNTAFVGPNLVMKVGLKQLSPLGRQKLNNFGQTFQMIISLHPLCACGQNKNTYGCVMCGGAIKPQIDKWNRISAILKKRQQYVEIGKELASGTSNKNIQID